MKDRESKVLSAIKNHWREFTIPPTIRDIQKATGITSTSIARYYMLRLEKHGAIKRIKSKPVPIEINQLIKESYQ